MRLKAVSLENGSLVHTCRQNCVALHRSDPLFLERSRRSPCLSYKARPPAARSKLQSPLVIYLPLTRYIEPVSVIFKGCYPSKMNCILKRRRGCAATSHELPIKNASHALRWSARSCTMVTYRSGGKLPSSYKELCVLRYGETPVSGRADIRCACINGPSCLPR